jgi:2-methylcitrate dehydratase PrpD
VTAAATFAAWALDLRAADIPADVRHAAKRHILDGFGCAIAAHRTGAAPYATALVDGADEATVIGSGARASVPRAALANGILIHALDYDDTHTGALVHSTAASLPAAMAVGEAAKATGADLLAAVIAGYEVTSRLGSAVTHGFHERGFHATSVTGVFASALIASKLLGSDRATTVSALGIAGSAAAGSLEFLNTGSSTKQLHPGFAAMNGIVAARLAKAGADGPATIFEGPHGLFRSYLGVDVDPDALTAGLGERWESTQITIKPYPACQLSHASLDAIVASGVAADAVDAITFELADGVSSIVADKPEPRTPYEGKFSLEYCAAALLIDGELGVGSFEPSALERADVRALAARIAWKPRPFDGPPAEAPGICEIRLKDGTVLRGEVSKSRGGPDAPLSDDELLSKFRSNGGTDAAANSVFSLDSRTSVDEVFHP